MEAWRRTWREGFAPEMPAKGLEALRLALAGNDPRLIQRSNIWPWVGEDDGRTTAPTAACAVCYCGWQGGLETVAAVEDFFGEACKAADLRLGEPSAVRRFLNWWDDEPWEYVRREMLAEAGRELALRAGKAGAA